MDRLHSKEVLKEKDSIEDGIGYPDWRLTLCLLASWITVFVVIMRGVHSTGKAAYFLALFPYVVLVVLLVRGCTLPGAAEGILFFVTPKWSALLNPNVWYAAVTQAFFSLSVSFGSIIMYSSYNNFNHNIHRDTLIVTSLDTCTSLLAGFTIFAILGNLAYEMGVEDISQVVRGGTGLAFVSYPDAIAKFDFAPQLFAAIFFLMLYSLGIGSSVSGANVLISVVCDQFKSLRYWTVALALCVAGFLTGLVYVTPGGQWILTLVDFYLVTFVLFVMSVAEVVTVAWVYGVDRFCRDVRFMLGVQLSLYWRLCWGVVTPAALVLILGYSLFTMAPLTYDGKPFPELAYTIVWTLAGFGVLQLPIWMVVEWVGRRHLSTAEMFASSFRPNKRWGPKDANMKKEWQEYCEEDLMKKEKVASAAF